MRAWKHGSVLMVSTPSASQKKNCIRKEATQFHPSVNLPTPPANRADARTMADARLRVLQIEI